MKRGFTLTEMLVVVAVAVTFISAASIFFSGSWTSAYRIIQRTNDSQDALILMKQWRMALENTDPTQWETKNGIFSAAGTIISATQSSLLISRGEARKEVRLPPGTTCTFQIEHEAGLAPVAVLQLEWNSKYLQKSKINTVRLAACGRQS
jgi:prepilin-type N-terminal cleavage/methylation domain-containing protein